jgi:hypothetical protein
MSLKLSIFLILLPAAMPQAQPQRQASNFGDSSVAAIMRQLRAGRDASWFNDVMRQTHGSVASAKLAELSDSLSERAIRVPATPLLEHEDVRAALASIGSLSVAGDRGCDKGTAYPGALDQLIRIHQQGNNTSVRKSALAAMPGVLGRPRGLEYLESVAASHDPTSEYAIEVLMIDASGGSWIGPKPSPAEQQQSQAILRELYRRRLVTDSAARELLHEWAARNHVR